jgi:pyruvate/2-oxoglutarate dehydrogenase complex dihydrolipoamide dehydrogenase (E3) component
MVNADVVVIGAGPAGAVAAARAARLGARTTLVTRADFGGMAANEGPVPVRTLAYAARLLRGTRQLARYGISIGEPRLDYSRLLARAREVVIDVRTHSALRERVDTAGVTVYEHAGTARFVDSHTIACERGPRVRADKVILCAGGTSRRLHVPGAELTATVTDAFALTDIPESMIVIGGGMTGLQVASIFQAFGSRVSLFQAAPRVLPGEDEDVSLALAAAFREAGMVVREGFGVVESFERSPDGVRMHFSTNGVRDSTDATVVVLAIGWVADTAGLNLPGARVACDARGYIRVDAWLRTSVPHVYAAGDITGRWMLAPQALHDGWIAATNAVEGDTLTLPDGVRPVGGLTEPEYASVGLTEAKARERHDVVAARVRFDETTRTIIDGRTDGFCKLLVDRRTQTILGCHVVGERAVEIVQVAAVAMAAGMEVGALARIPLSFPTYTGIIGRAASRALEEIRFDSGVREAF